MQFMTTSRSPSLSRSANAMPCVTPTALKPHFELVSSKVRSWRLRNATLGVFHVIVGYGGNEDVFPAVEVHVQKSDAPGPVRGRDDGELGNLSERAVTTGELEGIARDLGPEVRVPDGPCDGAPQRVRSLPGAELPSR